MTDRQWIIGSDSNIDLFIDDSVISRRHCRLSRRGDPSFIEDLASRNGTFLNSQRVVKLRSIPTPRRCLPGRFHPRF